MTPPEPSLFASLDEEAVSLQEAMEQSGRLLARRARSEREVRDALDRSSFDAAIVEMTLARLADLGLVDDLAFARQWVEERGPGKGLGPRRLLAELRSKGVDRETARQAVEGVGLDDEARAKEVAAGLVRKVAGRPLGQQALRLQQMLLARGFDLDTTLAAVRTALPPEGWD
ncbi:MAG: regulatory protein [Actinomycetota bacterium]|nr:regulatory protein [Actinomycetota bacterium]